MEINGQGLKSKKRVKEVGENDIMMKYGFYQDEIGLTDKFQTSSSATPKGEEF